MPYKFNHSLLIIALPLLSMLLFAACQEAPLSPNEQTESDTGSLEELQPRKTLVPLGKYNNNVPQLAGHSLRVVGIGANFGFAAASQVCSTGDLPCTFSTLSAAAYNGMSVAALRANYDVLIFTWISSGTINADWATRLVPYMNLGGGVIFEDPANIGDLAPGVTAFNLDASSAGMSISATVPGLTDGISNAFINNHIGFSAWTSSLSPFITRSGTAVGLQGRIGNGCIVLTGPDQHFHGFKGGGGASGNQYNLLVNEIDFVAHKCGVIDVDIDIKPGSDPNSINCDNENGVIAVAILTTPAFDATTVDHTTVTFEGASETHVNNKTGVAKRHEEDVDGDGDTDLVLHFKNGETGLTCASTSGMLTGMTFSGQPIEGSDAVRSVGG